jgi:hypothetical protein
MRCHCSPGGVFPRRVWSFKLSFPDSRELWRYALNSASDKAKAKIKMHTKFWGNAKPHDSIGELLRLSHHMANHMGAQNKQSFDQLKAYTDAMHIRCGGEGFVQECTLWP